MSKQSSVEFLEIQMIKNGTIVYNDIIRAKAMHKEEHAKTWDDAIEKLEARGGNKVRAIVDFDEYYRNIFEQ